MNIALKPEFLKQKISLPFTGKKFLKRESPGRRGYKKTTKRVWHG
jgi:hypothetical protein